MSQFAVDQAYRALERSVKDYCAITYGDLADTINEVWFRVLEEDAVFDAIVTYAREWYNEEHQR